MKTNSGAIAVVAIIAILFVVIIGAVIYLKMLHDYTDKEKTNYNYTDKDRDMMSLIHELSTIYDNIDQYLEN